MTSLGLSAECSRDSTKLRAVRQRTRKVYPCLSPCDWCKTQQGRWWGWLKISKLAWGFSDGHSINGSQETSCINRKGFLMFLSYGTQDQIRPIRNISQNPCWRRIISPAAYCPPGSICGMLSIPRALPPVTHGSALQAPERLLDTGDVITFRASEWLRSIFLPRI